MERLSNGDFEQLYTFGSIIKPLGGPPAIGDETSVAIQIAAARCFGTDDPGGDEPYLVTTVYAISSKLGELNPQTTRFGPDEFDPPVGDNTVFAQGRQLAHNFPVPGNSDIRIHMELMEQEHGNPDELKQRMSKIASIAVG